jgi:hypothetical protein
MHRVAVGPAAALRLARADLQRDVLAVLQRDGGLDAAREKHAARAVRVGRGVHRDRVAASAVGLSASAARRGQKVADQVAGLTAGEQPVLSGVDCALVGGRDALLGEAGDEALLSGGDGGGGHGELLGG